MAAVMRQFLSNPMTGEEVERAAPVGGQRHVVALELQRTLDRGAHPGFIVDDEDVHAASLPPARKRAL